MKRIILLLALVASSAAADTPSVFDFNNTLGKTRPVVQKLCKKEGGAWLSGSCVFDDGEQAVMFTWENNRVSMHSHFQQNRIYGYAMLKLMRKTAGEEDLEMPQDGCDLYLWANFEGHMFGITICDSTSGMVVGRVAK